MYREEVLKMKARIEAKQEKIDELKYELSLLENAAEATINRNADYVFTPWIPGATRWLQKKDKIDKRKSDLDKTAFKYLNDALERTTCRKVAITKIARCGWECYAWDVTFNVKDDKAEYRLQIPRFGNIEYKYADAAYWGHFALLKTEPGQGYWSLVWTGAEPELLNEYFKEGCATSE